MKIDEIINSLTIEEKASLLCGAKSMETKEIKEKNIPALLMSDGPCGLRCFVNIDSEENFNIGESNKASAFATGSSLACSWNEELFYKIGKAIAKECRYFGVHTILAPAVNIKRNPLCGRNFEYLSEDPIQAGILGREYVKGVQSENVLATPKHFACNNNEYNRHVGDSIVDERAFREIYLRQFEIIVKEANPGFIMTSYNRINGVHASENKHLHDILKNEWKFKGATMTDWGGLDHRDIALNNGEDLEMPGCLKENIDLITTGYNKGLIKEETINDSLRRLLTNIYQAKDNKCYSKDVFEENKKVAVESALESIVLLKNEDNILPLRKEDNIAIIGKYFTQPRYQGGGSSMVNPYFYDTPKMVFDENNISYKYAMGFDDETKKPNKKLEKEALDIAKDSSIILLFLGQNDFEEAETYDRDSMKLPDNQLSLVNELIKLNKKIVVLLYNGSSLELPFVDKVSAIMYVGLLGGINGLPLYQTLYGINNPSGRLAETWVKKYEDNNTSKDFVKTPIEVYKESIYVGYRYFESANIDVLYPFGYGLSYTKYDYSNLNISNDKDNVIVSVKVKNSGDLPGKEVVQVYLQKKSSNIFRPLKELKGFKKISLEKGEEKVVEIKIPLEYLKVFDVGQNRFVLENGDYTFIIGKNAHEDILKESISIDGEDIIKASNTDAYFDYSHLKELSNDDFAKLYGKEIPTYKKPHAPYDKYVALRMYKTLIGRIVVSQIKKEGNKLVKKSHSATDPIAKRHLLMNAMMNYKGTINNSLRSLIYSSSGYMSFTKALGMLDIVNGRVFRGLKKMKNN